jgi:hypothetical protein
MDTALTARSLHRTAVRRALRAAASGEVLADIDLTAASPAFAAVSGCGPLSASSSTSADGFTKVAASHTVGSSASQIVTTFDSETYEIGTPSGDFGTPTQVTVYAPTDLSAIGGLAGVETVFSNPTTNNALSGVTLKTPVDVVVKASGISKGDVVEVFNGGSYSPFAGTYSMNSGSATIELTCDPTDAVVSPAQAAAPTSSAQSPAAPSATSAHTGKPFRGEEFATGVAGAAGLAVSGAAASLRRRVSA